jgi:hypothetical protein
VVELTKEKGEWFDPNELPENEKETEIENEKITQMWLTQTQNSLSKTLSYVC